MGIRQKLAEEFGSSPNKDGKLGRQHQEDVIVTPIRSDKYKEELANSVFCGVFPGDGWSGRMEDSILQGCIPVIIQVTFVFLLSSNFSTIFLINGSGRMTQFFLHSENARLAAAFMQKTFGRGGVSFLMY